MLRDCKNLDEYFQSYGELLGARAAKALAPLHVKGRDPVHPSVGSLLRTPFDAQAHCITAITKAWQRQKSVILAAEMGVGKTLISIGAAHAHARGRPYRALVMCPDHLLSKWQREIHETISGVTVHHFTDWRDALRLSRERRKPTQGEWFLIGRDQSKFDPGKRNAPILRRQLIVAPQDVRRMRRDKERSILDFTQAVAQCPRCGTTISDRDGNPVGISDLKTKHLTCKGVVVRYERRDEEVVEVEYPCGEPLWQFTRKPWRWASYRLLHGNKFHMDYMVLDEAHEEKAADSAQANSAGALIASSRKVVALTGTLIGGYAEHIFPMMMRLDARSLIDAGFEWKGFGPFNARYGKIETTIHRSTRAPEEDNGRYNSHSKGRSSEKVTKRCRPGVMPQLYGDHLASKCVFLTLAEVSDNLPPLSEEIIPITMDAEQAKAYSELEDWFRDAIKPMLIRGDKRLLGKFLQTLLCYPDHPFGWGAIQADDDEFTPANLDPHVVRPKEEALIALVDRERSLGRQTWVYLTMTQVRDCGARLVDLLKQAGLRADYMKSSVDRRERERWIYKQGKSVDVVLSHPKLVETGLDLFAKDGNHNYPTLAFYQTGYNLFTLRQASRRSWRIAQPLPCKTSFMYYAGTMQAQAMTLMGKKMAAAEALEGKFSTEGLAAMAGEDDATMALARALVEKVPDSAERNWSRTLGFAPQAPVAAPPPTRKLSLSAEEIDRFRKLHARLCRA